MSVALLYSSASWPTQCAELQALLHLQDVNGMTCHGYAKTTKATCRNPIARANASRVPVILNKILAAGRNDNCVWQQLQDLASIVMCRRWHQNQAVNKSTTWWYILASRRAVEIVQPQETIVIENLSIRRHGLSATPASSTSTAQTTSRPIAVHTPHQPISRVEQYTANRTNASTSRSLRFPLDDSHNQIQRVSQPPGLARGGRAIPAARVTDNPPPSANTRSRTAQHVSQGNGGMPAQEFHLTVHVFVPYSVRCGPYQLNARIKDKLQKPLKTSELGADGCVYGFTFPSHHFVANETTTPYIKIGMSNNMVRRMNAWRNQCGYTPNLVFASSMPHYRRIETIVHTFFRNVRMRERGCPSCGVEHNEWFAVESNFAKSIVSLWQAWAVMRPYDESGYLLDTWRRRLENINLTDPSCWWNFVHVSVAVRPGSSTIAVANHQETTRSQVPTSVATHSSRATFIAPIHSSARQNSIRLPITS